MIYYFITLCVAVACIIALVIRLSRQSKRIDNLQFLLKIEKQTSMTHKGDADTWCTRASRAERELVHLEMERDNLRRKLMGKSSTGAN